MAFSSKHFSNPANFLHICMFVIILSNPLRFTTLIQCVWHSLYTVIGDVHCLSPSRKPLRYDNHMTKVKWVICKKYGGWDEIWRMGLTMVCLWIHMSVLIDTNINFSFSSHEMFQCFLYFLTASGFLKVFTGSTIHFLQI